MYLLDTHILLWWLADNTKLHQKAKTIIADPNNLIFVSSASIWEISIKKSIGKLKTPNNLQSVLQINNFQPLPITISHALAIEKLPPHHSDPFDRMLIVQTKLENLSLITQDKQFKAYKIPLLN